jgi:riboflavin synthase
MFSGTIKARGTIAATEIGDGFLTQVSNQTLSLSTFATITVAQAVNLEWPMLASSRFDGHIVSDHVDGVRRVLSCSKEVALFG